jgi:hypothetical protein
MAAVTRLQALQDRRVCFFFRVKNGVSTWHGLTIQWLGGSQWAMGIHSRILNGERWGTKKFPNHMIVNHQT